MFLQMNTKATIRLSSKMRPLVSAVLLYTPCSAVPTGTPVSYKFCLCISPVVPTGTPVSDKARI